MKSFTLFVSLALAFALSVVTRPASDQDKYYIKLKSATQGSFQPTQQAARGNGFMECKSIAFSSTAVNPATARSIGVLWSYIGLIISSGNPKQDHTVSARPFIASALGIE